MLLAFFCCRERGDGRIATMQIFNLTASKIDIAFESHYGFMLKIDIPLLQAASNNDLFRHFMMRVMP